MSKFPVEWEFQILTSSNQQQSHLLCINDLGQYVALQNRVIFCCSAQLMEVNDIWRVSSSQLSRGVLGQPLLFSILHCQIQGIHHSNPRFSCECLRKYPPSDIWHSLQPLHLKGSCLNCQNVFQTAIQQATFILQWFLFKNLNKIFAL